MPSFKMPTPIKRPTSAFYWIRKKVPERLRDLVGKTEIWASLGTKDQRRAAIKIGAVNAAIEAEWVRLRVEQRSNPKKEIEPIPYRLTHQDLHAMRRDEHVRIRDAWIKDPPKGFAKLRMHLWDEESVELDAIDLLEGGGYDASMENVERLKPLLIQARKEAIEDVEHARAGEYKKIADLSVIPPRTTPALDFIRAFEEYAEKGGLKGGKFGPTAKRWRPKIRAFCDFMEHRDLKRMTTADGYDWIDELMAKKIAPKSIKDVSIAALSATAGFMVERRKLDQNPFLRMKVRDDKSNSRENTAGETQLPPRKGFTPAEASLILTATVATPSHLISVEMKAARRWLPWLCAYSGARVNELTSLHPLDISEAAKGIHCMVIKPSLEKTANWRVVPIHSHIIAQGFLRYVKEREATNKPLFYDPDRSRGGKPGNPQFKKVAERIGEWVHGLGVPVGVKPNHAWRHLFKSVARHVTMDREVEGFITGHRPKNSTAGNDYGDRWIKTMSAEIEKYPRFQIAVLRKSAAPHKRHRRISAEVDAANTAKEKRKATRVIER
jgi:site-specific recombinase XerD